MSLAAGLGVGVGILGDLIGGHQNRQAQEAANAKNIEMQKEFAQNSIRWKVEDARKAGIAPLAALGAQTTSFAPSVVGDTSFGDSLSSASQNITRAMNVAKTEPEKQMAALHLAGAKLDLEGKEIENAIKAQQLNQMALHSPGMPMAGSDNFIPGQGNSGLVREKPLERTVSAPGRPAQEAGWRPDVSYSRTDTGLTPMVPTSLSESLEDDIIGKFLWRIRNQVAPNIDESGAPPKNMLPPGYDTWNWSHRKQEWQPGNYHPYLKERVQYYKGK